MQTHRERCAGCGKNLTVGFHLVSRYEDEHGVRIYHRACYEDFMVKEAERRAKVVEEDFQKSLAFKRLHGCNYVDPVTTNV